MNLQIYSADELKFWSEETIRNQQRKIMINYIIVWLVDTR